jgi:hypothetical protein
VIPKRLQKSLAFLSPVLLIAIFLVMQFSLVSVVWHSVKSAAGMLPLIAPELTVTGVTLVLVYVACCQLQKMQLKKIGLDPTNMAQEIAIGFGLGIAVAAAPVAAMALGGAYHVDKINPFNPLLICACIAMFLVALNEELMFRVFIFQTAERKWGTVASVVITSTIFGCMHLMNDVHGATILQKLWGALSLIPEAGLLLNAALLVRRRIWLPVGIHWAWNFFEGSVFGTDVSGTNLGATVIEPSIAGPGWLTGGAFGPEASLFGVLMGTALSAILIWFAIKHGDWKKETTAPDSENTDNAQLH